MNGMQHFSPCNASANRPEHLYCMRVLPPPALTNLNIYNVIYYRLTRPVTRLYVPA